MSWHISAIPNLGKKSIKIQKAAKAAWKKGVEHWEINLKV